MIKRKVKKLTIFSISLISLLAGIFLSALQPIYASGITRLFLTAPALINAGDEFDVQVNIVDVVDLAGFEIDLQFDHTKFKVVSFSRGNFLGAFNDPESTYWKDPDLSSANACGVIENVACTKIGEVGKSGSGTLCTVRLKDIAGGITYSSNLAFPADAVFLSDILPSLIQAVKTGLTIFVAGDSDADGLFDPWEIASFASLDEDGNADHDGDGETNLFEYTHSTDPCDARSTSDPNHSYNNFHFEIYRAVKQTSESESYIPAFWGAILICRPREGEIITSATLAKPSSTCGERFINLQIEADGSRAMYQSDDYALGFALWSDFCAGEYLVHLETCTAEQECHDLIFKINVPYYTIEDFPGFISVENPSPSAVDIAWMPLLQFNTDRWNYLNILTAIGQEVYSYINSAPSSQHQVQKNLNPATEYLLSIDRNDRGTTWLGSKTLLPLTLGWISFDNFLQEKALQMPVQNLTARAFRFKALSAGLTLKQIIEQDTTFHQFLLPGGRLFGEVGQPALPGFTRLVAVPKDANMVITINEGESHVLENCLIYPMQEQPRDDQDYPLPPFTMDSDFYQSTVSYPDSLISIREDWVRGCKVALINIHTCRYNPGQRKLLYYPNLDVDIQFEGGDGTYIPLDHRSRFFEESYAHIFSNYESVKMDEREILRNRPALGTLFDPCDLLIITPTSLETVANQLAEWKNERGFLTKVVTLTKIYEAQNGQTVDHIRAYIKNIYENQNLSYVLLLGDSGYIPCHYVTPDSHAEEGSFIGTDLYYAEMDYSGYFPDLGIGRIPVDSAYEARIVVDKIIKYEQNPPDHSRFYQKIACCAFFEDDNQDGREDVRYVETMEEIRDFFLSEEYPSPPRIYTTNSLNPLKYQDGTSIPAALWMPGFDWTGDTTDLINEINSGTFLVIHRDHAGPGGWSHPGFHTDDLTNLTNGDLLPVVLSINCSSGYFDYYSSLDPYWESFAEELLLKDAGGAVAVIAASRTSPTYPNDDLTKGLIDGIWPAMLSDFPTAGDEEAAMLRFSSKLGDSLNYAKFYLTTRWSEATCLEEFEMYHCLGDPTMEIWTKSPHQIPFQTGPIQLDKLIYTLPVEEDDALVSIIQNGKIIGQGYSFSGQVTIALAEPLSYSSNTKISVTKEGHITQVHPAEFVNKTFFPDTDGDGFGNPGQSIQSPFCPEGYVEDSSDCDDGNSNINPGNLGIINKDTQASMSDFMPGAHLVTIAPTCSQYDSYSFLEFFWNRGKRLAIHQSSMAESAGKRNSTYWFFGKPGGGNYILRQGVIYKVFGN